MYNSVIILIQVSSNTTQPHVIIFHFGEGGGEHTVKLRPTTVSDING